LLPEALYHHHNTPQHCLEKKAVTPDQAIRQAQKLQQQMLAHLLFPVQ
jgi:hypothetical protein